MCAAYGTLNAQISRGISTDSSTRPLARSPARPLANLSAHGLTVPLHQAGGEDLLPLPQRRHPAASP